MTRLLVHLLVSALLLWLVPDRRIENVLSGKLNAQE